MERQNIFSKEIATLEKEYNIQMKGIYDEDHLEHLSNAYLIDKKGKIRQISLSLDGIKDFKVLSIFQDLEYLSLTSNNIESIDDFANIKTLKALYLGNNEIKDISSLCKLSSLKELAIWENPIADFDQLLHFKNLKKLFCQRTNSKTIDFVKNMKNLEFLYADGNEIESISVLKNLSKLKKVRLSNNKISDLSPIENIRNLFYIDLTNNLVKYISKTISKKFNNSILNFDNNETDDGDLYDKAIIVENNPLEFPPNSVIELGNDTIDNYYTTAESYGHEPLSEGRIIFVGDGSAGKSSLIERVLFDTFEISKEQTNGIKIEQWGLIHKDGRDLSFHIWDFGGQEIQHAVHKFFFTEGCLYVLVLDNRKEEEPEYWLQQIESLGGSAPVIVAFNKQDHNPIEIADRKFLKEKYPNIVSFHNTSCLSSSGIKEFKIQLIEQAIKLRTVEEQFPNNWFDIKRSIEEFTSGSQHYLTFDKYKAICTNNHVISEDTQRLLLKYFTTIGAVTWFGDTYLSLLHVLSPAWITQGVYKIITAKQTANSLGHINISNFKDLLQPNNDKDYHYDENHYGYILSMMKKFDLCYTSDDRTLLLPSAFGKVPKLEYSEFRGSEVRTYILQFRDYMPMALIHRFIAKKLSDVYDNNYWYSGIVIKDSKTDSLAMIQADKEAKRIYVRIKGNSHLGIWEYIRREIDNISSNYASINYSELLSLDGGNENTVDYQDLLSHIRANKSVYFHAKQQKDYNVGFLMGFFENRESTIEKFKNNRHSQLVGEDKDLNLVVQILNNNSSFVNTRVDTSININLHIINELNSNMKGDANYLLEALENLSSSNKSLSDSLIKLIEFTDFVKENKNVNDIKENGWGRKLKKIVSTLSSSGEQIKNIEDGTDTVKSIIKSIKEIAQSLNLNDLLQSVNDYFPE